MNNLIDGLTSPSSTITLTINPETTGVNPAYVQWFKQDQLLLSWILSSLTEEVFSYIISCKTSLEA